MIISAQQDVRRAGKAGRARKIRLETLVRSSESLELRTIPLLSNHALLARSDLALTARLC